MITKGFLVILLTLFSLCEGAPLIGGLMNALGAGSQAAAGASGAAGGGIKAGVGLGVSAGANLGGLLGK